MSDEYDPEEREREKQRSRDQDAAEVAAGRKTLAQLCDENTAIRLSGARIDWAKVPTIRKWKRK